MKKQLLLLELFITTTLMMARNWRLLSVVAIMTLIQMNIKAMLLSLRK